MPAFDFEQSVLSFTTLPESGTYTHINISSGDRYFVTDKRCPEFYSLITESIRCEHYPRIGERYKDSCLLMVRFFIGRNEFNGNDLVPIHSVINKILRVGLGRPDMGSILSVVYWMDGYLYFSYPEIVMTIDHIRITESKIREDLHGEWGKMLETVFNSDYVQMYTYGVEGMIGVYRSAEDSHRPERIDYEVVFEDQMDMLSRGGMLAGVNVKQEGVIDYLHLLLSIHNLDFTVTEYKETEYRELIPTYDVDIGKSRADEEINFDIEDAIDEAEMMEMWSDRRFESISEWYTLGEVCYNNHKSSRRGIDAWFKLTQVIVSRLESKGLKVPEHLTENVKDHIEIQYYTYKRDRVTVNTAAWIAREDSPEKFARWHLKWRKTSMMDATSGRLADIARDFWKKYFLDFMCEPQGKGYIWYIFDKSMNRLKSDTSGNEVAKQCMWRFRNDYRKMRRALTEEVKVLSAIKNPDIKTAQKVSFMNATIALIVSLEEKLMESYSDTIVRYAARYFSNPNASSFFDKNFDLLCAKTGVIVATRKDILVRQGRPQDYLTKEIGAHYAELTWKHPVVVRLMYWVKQTFVDPGLIEYWLMFIASLLRGGNPDKIFPIIYGPSNAGKSAWVRTIQQFLDSKCVKGTMALLTSEQTNPHGPTSILVDFGEARLVLFEEAEEGGKPLRASFVKYATGSDSYYAARKHKDGVQITPGYLAAMVTNSIPESSSMDDAIKNRIVIMPAISKWNMLRGGKSMSIEEQFNTRTFEADLYFDDNAKGYGMGLLWIAIQIYPLYLKKGLSNKPEIVQRYTDKYWEEKDMYHQFELEKINVTNNDEDRMSVTDIKEMFNNWHDDSYKGRSPPTRPKLIEELGRRWGPPVDGVWRGIKKIKPSYSRESHGEYDNYTTRDYGTSSHTGAFDSYFGAV